MSEVQVQAEFEVKREIMLNHEIESRVSQLIRTGAKAVRTLKPPPGKKSGMEESQFRNLLNVAAETSSVDVITNFIRYQIGRSERIWGSSESDFGPTLIRDIEAGDVIRAAQAVQSVLSEKLKSDAPDLDVFDQAHLRLTRLYLGYAMRIFYYCKKREEAGHEHAWENLYRSETEGA